MDSAILWTYNVNGNLCTTSVIVCSSYIVIVIIRLFIRSTNSNSFHLYDFLPCGLDDMCTQSNQHNALLFTCALNQINTMHSCWHVHSIKSTQCIRTIYLFIYTQSNQHNAFLLTFVPFICITKSLLHYLSNAKSLNRAEQHNRWECFKTGTYKSEINT